MKAALIDFRDSFTFNIAHYLEGENLEVAVFDDETMTLDDLEDFELIVLSPGPGLPREKKHLLAVLDRYSGSKSILGICLGMQGVVEYFGGTLYNQKKVQHGVQVKIDTVSQDPILFNLPEKFNVGLYHSWACQIEESSSSRLKVLSRSEDSVIMIVKHVDLPVYGFQFHPESILTEYGRELIRNFIKIAQV